MQERANTQQTVLLAVIISVDSRDVDVSFTLHSARNYREGEAI